MYGNGSSILRIGSLKVFRGSERFHPHLDLTVPGPRSVFDQTPELRYGWECFFVSVFGAEKTVYTYRKRKEIVPQSIAARHEEIYGEDDDDRAYEASLDRPFDQETD